MGTKRKKRQPSLDQVLSHIPETMRLRLKAALKLAKIDSTEAVVKKSFSNINSIPKIGNYTIQAFAKALSAEGIDCDFTRHVFQAIPGRQEDAKMASCILEDRDWLSIYQISMNGEKLLALQKLHANRNHPTPLSDLFPMRQSRKALVALRIRLNDALRAACLPYRLMIVSGRNEADGQIMVKIGIIKEKG